MSIERRIKKIEESSSDRMDSLYMLWKDDADTFRDKRRNKVYTAKEVEQLDKDRSNHVIIAKWVGADDV